MRVLLVLLLNKKQKTKKTGIKQQKYLVLIDYEKLNNLIKFIPLFRQSVLNQKPNKNFQSVFFRLVEMNT